MPWSIVSTWSENYYFFPRRRTHVKNNEVTWARDVIPWWSTLCSSPGAVHRPDPSSSCYGGCFNRMLSRHTPGVERLHLRSCMPSNLMGSTHHIISCLYFHDIFIVLFLVIFPFVSLCGVRTCPWSTGEKKPHISEISSLLLQVFLYLMTSIYSSWFDWWAHRNKQKKPCTHRFACKTIVQSSHNSGRDSAKLWFY